MKDWIYSGDRRLQKQENDHYDTCYNNTLHVNITRLLANLEKRIISSISDLLCRIAELRFLC